MKLNLGGGAKAIFRKIQKSNFKKNSEDAFPRQASNEAGVGSDLPVAALKDGAFRSLLRSLGMHAFRILHECDLVIRQNVAKKGAPRRFARMARFKQRERV